MVTEAEVGPRTSRRCTTWGLIAVYGTDYGVRDHMDLPLHRHHTTGRRMPDRRVLLAGSAHVHSPIGGQGLNAGVQDMNLGWNWRGRARLAGQPPTYPRATVGARVLRNTMARSLHERTRSGAPAQVVPALGLDEAHPGCRRDVRTRVRYDLGPGTRWNVAPDLDIKTDQGTHRHAPAQRAACA